MVDDTEWATARQGSLLITDHSTPGTIYKLTRTGGFPGRDTAFSTPYTNVAVLNTRTGATSTVASGFVAPKGLLFVPSHG
jgi:hypothetical protein